MPRTFARLSYLLLLSALLSTSLAARATGTGPRHGISLFGELHYPPGFTHFEYVDPNAPKGGLLRLPAIGSFDNLHPFIRKGRNAAGMSLLDGYIYDRLTAPAEDEPASRYGLLAETVELAPDGTWIEFVLRENARWHDGQPVTADDVVFTFESIQKLGSPVLQVLYTRVDRVEKRGPRTVRFVLKDAKDRQLPLLVAGLAVLPKHYWEGREFDHTTLEPPLGSGPYRIAKLDPGRSITYERVPDYWGKDLPVNVGRNNFDRIQYEYFLDNDVRLEAVKAGVVDFTLETVSKTWAEGYNFPARERGEFVLETLETQAPAVVRGLAFNTRLPKFQDVRVRQALAYAYDREFTIRVHAHGAYEPANSYFAGSELAQKGPPGAAELALLEPYRSQLPAQLFEREFAMPPTPGTGRNRENLRVAARLLREAGYEIRDGRLVDSASGKPFTVDIMLDAAARVRFTLAYADALKQLGIDARMRVVDSSQLVNRRRNFDFEMIYVDLLNQVLPGTNLRNYYSSAFALSPNTQNYAGIRNPVADALIEKAIGAETHEQLIAVCRALDRVLLWNYYTIDLGVAPGARYAYWDRFGRPAVQPRYSTGFPFSWWFVPAKDARIRSGKNVEAKL